MAHMLDLTNAGPGMAYVGETPWHKLGTKVEGVPNVSEMIEAARLGWRVVTEPIVRVVRDGSTIADPGKRRILYRTDTGAPLDVVGPRFQVTQNEDALEFLQAFCDANAATLETVGALKGGRLVWGLARMNSEWTAGKLANGRPDAMLDYLLIMLPHMQAKALTVQYVQTRVVCWNTLSVALAEDGHVFRMSHTKQFDSTARNRAQEAMGLAVAASAELQTVATRLAGVSFGASQLDAFLCRLVQASDEDARAILDGDEKDMPLVARRVRDAFHNAPGHMPNAWGALNAVTWTVDHARKNIEASATSGLMGSGAILKARALALLTI